jgi:hypothetical protein
VATASEPAAAPAAPAVVETVKEEKKAEETKAESKVSEAKDLGCKKFIPAVGFTVSVGCKD